MQPEFVAAARTIRRAPLFSVRIVLPIALGIALSTIAFAAFDSLILRALPYPHADQLVLITGDFASGGIFHGGLSIPDMHDIQHQASSFTAIGATKLDSDVNFSAPGRFAQIGDALVSGELFKAIGVRPILGRSLLPEDNDPSRSSVVVLSYGLWHEMFGDNPDVLGRTIHLNDKPFAIVGVMPSGFSYPNSTTQLWLPEPYTPDLLSDRLLRDEQVLARLKAGISVRRAQAELDTISDRIARASPQSNLEWEFTPRSLEEDITGPVRPSVETLLAATLVILLIACANVANLLLIRNISRRQEIAIRMTLGASRFRLFRQLISEIIMLTLAAGIVGVALSLFGIPILHAVAPLTTPQLQRASVSPALVLYGFSIALFTGVLFGTIPALHASRLDLSMSLREGFHHVGTFTLRGHRLRTLFVCLQITLAVMLAMASAWMVRSLVRLAMVPIGFQPDSLEAVELSRTFRYQKALFFRSVVSNVDALPGVYSAALVSLTPFRGDSMQMMISPEDTRDGQRITPFVEFRTVSPEYFNTMQIPLLQGRTFGDGDRETSPCVIVVNQSMARTLWPGENALGKRIQLGGAESNNPYYCAIVGIAGDSRDIALESPPVPEMYFSDIQRPALSYSLVIRTIRRGPGFAASIRDRVSSLRKSEELTGVLNVEDAIEVALAGPRVRSEVAGVFAVASLLLALVGIYGVTAYSATMRQKEIGIRIALGAQRRDILKIILRDSVVVTGLGIALGMGAAFALGRILQNLLFEISSTDSASLVFVPMIVLAASVLAGYVPARAASRANPADILRQG